MADVVAPYQFQQDDTSSEQYRGLKVSLLREDDRAQGAGAHGSTVPYQH